MRMVRSRSGRKPGFTCCSLTKLRIIKPAAARRTTLTATCATTNAPRSVYRPRLNVLRLLAFRKASVSDRPEDSAGGNPNTTPVAIEISSAKNSTGASIRTSAARVVKRSANFASTSKAAGASANPSNPPPSDSSTLSGSTCRTSRVAHHPRNSPPERQQLAFCEHLPYEPRPGGAQRGADRELALEFHQVRQQ